MFVHLFFQREEIICCLAELLTEKKNEILSANKKDMELATASGTKAQLCQCLSLVCRIFTEGNLAYEGLDRLFANLASHVS